MECIHDLYCVVHVLAVSLPMSCPCFSRVFAYKVLCACLSCLVSLPPCGLSRVRACLVCLIISYIVLPCLVFLPAIAVAAAVVVVVGAAVVVVVAAAAVVVAAAAAVFDAKRFDGAGAQSRAI